ncbi:MAG: hypothetical protein H6661_13950 [Ardenticatenaceae bacterium]|nr:hypothetical protein [Ardenticatenaceae bacterium]
MSDNLALSDLPGRAGDGLFDKFLESLPDNNVSIELIRFTEIDEITYVVVSVNNKQRYNLPLSFQVTNFLEANATNGSLLNWGDTDE